MIHAFKDQLERMSVEEKKQFHQLVRKRIGKRATAVLEKRLRELILFMPTIISSTFIKWSQEDSPKRTKKLAGFMLTYLYHPKDFLAEEEFGLFGYLDDAYFVSTVYKEVLKADSEFNGGLSQSEKEHQNKIQELQKAARLVIPKETASIERMVEEIASGNDKAFIKMFQE